jgi:hypothetical protein
MLTNLGIDGDVGEGEVLGFNLGCVVDVSAKGGGEVFRVVVQAFNCQNICKKIPVIEFNLQAPDLVLIAVDDGVQVGVSVLDGSICGDGKEVGVIGAEVVMSFFKW